MTGIQKISLDDVSPANSQPSSSLDLNSSPSLLKPRLILAGLAIFIGSLGGYFLAQRQLVQAGLTSSNSAGLTQNPSDESQIQVGSTFGSPDEKSFKDHAQGIIQPGGIDGEGTHHLERGDNPSQWVYLTSSVIDLDLFVTDEVELWGETFQGKKAGWLMDVGRLKVVSLRTAEINNIESVE